MKPALRLADLPARMVSPLDRKPPTFGAADKALIAKLHGYMPPKQLLDVLNERLEADHRGAVPFTMEQLHAEIGSSSESRDANDWSSLRKIVAQARRDGVLDQVTRQVIDDFAVVFSLTPAQVLRLQDVLLTAKEQP